MGHDHAIPAIAWNPFHPDSCQLALSVSWERDCHLFQVLDTSTGQLITKSGRLPGQATALHWNPVPQTPILAVGYNAFGFECYDIRASSTAPYSRTHSFQDPTMTKSAWSADGQTLAFGSTLANLPFSSILMHSHPPLSNVACDGTIGLYDLRTGRTTRIHKAHSSDVTLLRWCPWDSHILITSSWDLELDDDRLLACNIPSVVKMWNTRRAMASANAGDTAARCLEHTIHCQRRIIGMEFISPSVQQRQLIMFSFIYLRHNALANDPTAVVWDYSKMRPEAIIDQSSSHYRNYYHMTFVNSKGTDKPDILCHSRDALVGLHGIVRQCSPAKTGRSTPTRLSRSSTAATGLVR